MSKEILKCKKKKKFKKFLNRKINLQQINLIKINSILIIIAHYQLLSPASVKTNTIQIYNETTRKQIWWSRRKQKLLKNKNNVITEDKQLLTGKRSTWSSPQSAWYWRGGVCWSVGGYLRKCSHRAGYVALVHHLWHPAGNTTRY